MKLDGPAWRSLAAGGIVGFLAVAACASSSNDLDDDSVPLPARKPEATAAVDAEAGAFAREGGAGREDQDAAADAHVAGSCSGRVDGTLLDPAAPLSRCCGEQPALMNSSANCGGCGITCPAGNSCDEVLPGQWGCHCASNEQCRLAGYGPDATCYETYCNCQCASSTSTCAATCGGGATCFDVDGQNYCSY